MKKKDKRWLYLGIAGLLIVIFAYMAYSANIMGVPFLSQAFAVIGPDETAYVGDEFEHIFTLTNRETEVLPVDTATRKVRLYKGFRMTDPAGTIVTTGCNTPDGSCDYVEEVITTMNPGDTATISVLFTISADTPSSCWDFNNDEICDDPGTPYGISSMLFAVEQQFQRETNDWLETPYIIDSVEQNNALAVKFNVLTMAPPPTPTVNTIMQWFSNLFASIWEFLKGLFGWL